MCVKYKSWTSIVLVKRTQWEYIIYNENNQIHMQEIMWIPKENNACSCDLLTENPMLALKYEIYSVKTPFWLWSMMSVNEDWTALGRQIKYMLHKSFHHATSLTLYPILYKFQIIF